MSGPFAFVTILSSDSYLPGALVLAASLRDLHPTPPVAPEVDFKTVCIVTPETVDVKSIKALRKAFDLVIGVEVFEAENSTGLQLLGESSFTVPRGPKVRSNRFLCSTNTSSGVLVLLYQPP
jgi:glycogenin glucosyltransferase